MSSLHFSLHSNGGSSSEGGCEKQSSRDKNFLDLSIGKIHINLEQPEMEGMDGSSGGDKAAATIVGGGKRNDSDKESLCCNKGKRGLEPINDDSLMLKERKKRKKMGNMFLQLQALIPELPYKKNKCTIIDEAVSYIKTLQQTLQCLEEKKLERIYGLSTSFLADQGSSSCQSGTASQPRSTSFSFPLCLPQSFQTWASSNVTLNVRGLDAHINICSSRKLGLFAEICFILEKYKLEIVSANISSNCSKSMYMIHTHASGQIMGMLPYVEIYQQAAVEITHLVNSESS